MEEQKKEEQTTGKKKSFKEVADNLSGGSVVLWCLAGFYLLYTGYKLCSNVIKGVGEGGIGFFLVGIVFLVIGGLLLYCGFRARFKPKNKAEEEAGETKVQTEAVDESREEGTEPEKMSIAQRAALVGHVDEEQENSEEE